MPLAYTLRGAACILWGLLAVHRNVLGNSASRLIREALLQRAYSIGIGPHYTDREVDSIVAAVRIALLVDPDDRSVILFRQGMNPIALRGSNRIDLDDILPGFDLTVDNLFASLRIE